jgi:hypothetical protein
MTDQPPSGRRQQLQWEAEKRAQAPAGVFDELSELSPSAAASKLNERGVKALTGISRHSVDTLTVS